MSKLDSGGRQFQMSQDCYSCQVGHLAPKILISPLRSSKNKTLGLGNILIEKIVKSGFRFGITLNSTLDLIVGLSSGTHSELAVIGGILSIAIA